MALSYEKIVKGFQKSINDCQKLADKLHQEATKAKNQADYLYGIFDHKMEEKKKTVALEKKLTDLIGG